MEKKRKRKIEKKQFSLRDRKTDRQSSETGKEKKKKNRIKGKHEDKGAENQEDSGTKRKETKRQIATERESQ